MAAFTIGAILGGLGLGSKLYGQKQAADAIDRRVSNVLAEQMRTQDRLDQERQQKVSDALAEMSVGKEQTENAQDKRISEMLSAFEANSPGAGGEQGADPAPASEGSAEGPAGKVFSSHADQLASAREADTQQRRQSMAELDSLADVFNENNLTLQPYQTEIGLNQRTAREEAQRLPLETQVATQRGAQKGRGFRMAGDLALNTGTALMAGGSGGPWASYFGGGSGGGGTAKFAMNHPTAIM